MIGYGKPHHHPWVGMRGISREGEPAILKTIWNSRYPYGACLRWKYLDTYHHAFTDINGSTAHWNPAREMDMDVLWWELPTFEQVLLTQKGQGNEPKGEAMSTPEKPSKLTPEQLAERDARVKEILGGFDDEDTPAAASTPAPEASWAVSLKAGEELTAEQLAERDAYVKQLMGGFDEDEPTPAPTPAPAPAPAPTAPLSTCAIAPTSTGHKLTLQVESDADLHSLTTWLLECLESLPA